MKVSVSWTGALIILFGSGPLYAAAQPVVFTLDTYVDKAVKQGIANKLNEFSLETAGYTREIAFRETDSPSFVFNNVTSRGESVVNGFPVLTNAQTSTLGMTEVTPLGTTLSAAGQWAHSGGTLGAPETYARPGFSASVTQPIYLFVKNSVLRTRQAARFNFADQKGVYQTTRLSLRSQARALYYNVMLSGESIKADERKVTSSKKLLDVTQALVDAGKSAPVETMRAKIQAEADARQLQNDQVLKEQSLLQAKNFAYLPLDLDVRFVTELEFSPFTLPLQRVLDYAILHNPQLESLRNRKQIARLDYEAALEPTRPTWLLNGTYNAADAGTVPDVQSHGWTWKSTVNWLFFDSFVTSDRARSAHIAEWAADLNLQNGERTLIVNVRSQYLDIKRTEKQIQDFKFSKEQSQRNVEVLRVRFQNGLTTLLDVLNAEDQMRGLDTEYLQLLIRFNESKDRLSELLGAEVETLL